MVATMINGEWLLVLSPFIWWILGGIGGLILHRKGYGRTTPASGAGYDLKCGLGGPITLLVALFRPSLHMSPPYIDVTPTVADVATSRRHKAMREELRHQGLDV
jgi:hypothetical protein